ncbi:hypothetical protein B9Z19DRAFT_990287 [Tuber borchii]|uniref:Integrase core domain-containing protein n=1 Tax=Tuber borchii TaxID=42251 RepID=A0A2T6ZM53_TUBBO|nr:hypothetical protein B9Z19DRAFT_990287 [Tuber borchii]
MAKGGYFISGLNYIWSIDGHHKLSMYGIEIYAGVDAYSRYIPWIYMGISTRTGISCLHQYLEVISQTNILPHSIRSD